MDTQASPEPRTRTLHPPFRSVLVPTDISETGNLAVPLAYHLTRPGGTVHLLHVCQPPFFGNPMYGQYVQGYVPTAEDLEFGRAKVRASLRQLPPESAIGRDIHTEIHLIDGVNASRTIEEQAEAVRADVVVMATHGRTGLKKMFMGSVAADVLKKKRLPVILVHRDGMLTSSPDNS